MTDGQTVAAAIGGLVTGIGALATTVKVLANRKNGSGHSAPCDSLVEVLRKQGEQDTAIEVIKVRQENANESIERIERNVGRLVDGLLQKTDPGITDRRTEG